MSIWKSLGLAVAGITLTISTATAQKLPRKVHDVTLTDLYKQSTQLPYFGQKHLLIFYVDPDHHKQNEEFTYELEENGRAHSDNIYAFGIMNLKDAPMVPTSQAR